MAIFGTLTALAVGFAAMASPAATLKPGDTFKDCADCPEMVVIAPGSYVMGDMSRHGSESERPAHEVEISQAFAAGKYPVTFDEWDACVAGGGCNGYRPFDGIISLDKHWGRGNRPVVNVNWKDAQAYVRWLSRHTGGAYRLLSESEWEYVARAGAGTTYPFGNDVTAACQYGNGWLAGICDDGYREVSPVGRFKPNSFGVYDTVGGVWELVEDCWHANYVGAPADGSAWTRGGDCRNHVCRGGAYTSGPKDLRTAARECGRSNGLTKEGRADNVGFRVAKSLSP